jgi:hypothetical protein
MMGERMAMAETLMKTRKTTGTTKGTSKSLLVHCVLSLEFEHVSLKAHPILVRRYG